MKTINWVFKSLFVILGLQVIVSCQPKTDLELPAIFSDNMVLQQNQNITIWGVGNPKSKVLISADWGTQSETTVNADSTWKTTLSTIDAGGPYNISISSEAQKIEINNVLLGEVWLGSGQSNMEMPLAGWPPMDTIEHSAATIANADNPNIRMFTVVKNTSSIPLNNLTGSWELSSPETAGDFSATAYFFALKLYEELNVPIGIIHSSWGGSPIEAWISNDMLSIDTDFKEITEKLKSQSAEQKKYNQWLSGLKSVNIVPSNENKHPFKGVDVFNSYFTNPKLETSDWNSMKLPGNIEQTEMGEFDGVVWFRKEFVIPTSWEGKELTVSLGAIDDMDVTYLNGNVIGAYEEAGFWQTERKYTVAGDNVKSGEAIISIKMIDTQGGGGFTSAASTMSIHPTNDPSVALSLAGDWKYKVAAEITGGKMYLFDPETDEYANRPKVELAITSHTPSAIYNAMIAPLLPYTIKGAIWYQGETNVGRANQYMRLTSMLITDWRNRFKNEEMPFYYVQLAPWHYNDPSSSSSANLREAQRRMLHIPNSGMAVTLDIGNLDNIHPAKKKEVGERLSLWALNNEYEIETPYTGPMFTNKEIAGNKIILNFNFVNGGLEIRKEVPNQFEISDENGQFHTAQAKVVGDKIEVSSDKVKAPVDVRYAYKNGSQASIFNGAGLPAPSFTTENEIED
ncbi:MAG TPA: sialate O-acetylesterase [Marinilabiliaceae bacterium]|nr:sialate O-acetylesterase [Marinilabiliaceae bacterium]